MSTMARSRQTALKAGDVLRTNPKPGYWGCAVVLRGPTEKPGFYPMCHIGIAAAIFRHEYGFSDLTGLDLRPIAFERGVRLSPDSYGTRQETCIGIWVAKTPPTIPIIGHVDPLTVWPSPLTDEVGDGSGNAFPLYGPIKPDLGSEAVSKWRREHDAEAHAIEVAAARASTEKLFAKLREQERAKRQKRHGGG